MQAKLIKCKKIERTIDSLRENKIPHKLAKTSLTTTLTLNNLTFKQTKGGLIKNKELFFIKKVKDFVLNNSQGIYCNRSKIKYIKEGNITKNRWYSSQIWEIDLNAAYWNFAYKFGYIDKELYLQGKKVSKLCRLVSLGNLAKVTTILNFNGVDYEFIDQIKSENTEGVFFSVSLKTDEIMNICRTIADKNFMFYWVDAVFVKTEKAKNEIIDYLNSQNIEFKIKKINKVYKDNLNIQVFDNNGTRKFYYKQLN